jgi:hypothetical protein
MDANADVRKLKSVGRRKAALNRSHHHCYCQSPRPKAGDKASGRRKVGGEEQTKLTKEESNTSESCRKLESAAMDNATSPTSRWS